MIFFSCVLSAVAGFSLTAVDRPVADAGNCVGDAA